MTKTKEGSFNFKDISNEVWRQYRFPDDEVVRIDNPEALDVSASGGHRVADGEGVSHYIPPGWIHLTWRSRGGFPPFSF